MRGNHRIDSDDSPVVYLVDDDDDVRQSLEFLLEVENIPYQSFADAEALLATISPESCGCLLLDVQLPGMNGLELHVELKRRRIGMPVLFISGHGDIPMAVRAVNAGALDFLEKPFHDQALLDKLEKGFQMDAERRRREARREPIAARLETLTPRERDVLDGIVAGKLNKQIADDLDISIRTVELHRGRVMEKMQAANAAELVRIVLDQA